jgi:hypothetical protein
MLKDLPHGFGKLVKSTGGVKYGRFDKGVLLKSCGKGMMDDEIKMNMSDIDISRSNSNSTDKDENKNMQGKKNKFKEFPALDSNGEKFDGIAIITYSNGDRYAGHIINGIRHGRVKLLSL